MHADGVWRRAGGRTALRLALLTVSGALVSALLPALAVAASAPIVTGESVSGVTGADAMLEAQINPEGQNVRYQFQLVSSPSEYASELECPEPSATPEICVGTHVAGALPIGLVPDDLMNPLAAQPVRLDVASAGVTLKPDTTYHYRVLAAPAVPSEDTIEWEGPPVYGADEAFTTPPAPVIESESLSRLSPTDATLQARIDTEGLQTSFTFYVQAVPFACLEAEPPCMVAEPAPVALPSGELLGSEISQSVSADLNSAGIFLHPGERYRYWVSVSSAGGSSNGAVGKFQAPEDAVQPPTATTRTSSGSGSGVQTTEKPAVQSSGTGTANVAADLAPGRSVHHRRGHARHRKRHGHRRDRKRHHRRRHRHSRAAARRRHRRHPASHV